MREGKLILLHGFTHAEAIAMMRALKAAAPDPGEIAFAVTTETNLEWRVKDLVNQVREEHEYLKANPPDPQRGINEEEPPGPPAGGPPPAGPPPGRSPT